MANNKSGTAPKFVRLSPVPDLTMIFERALSFLADPCWHDVFTVAMVSKAFRSTACAMARVQNSQTSNTFSNIEFSASQLIINAVEGRTAARLCELVNTHGQQRLWCTSFCSVMQQVDRFFQKVNGLIPSEKSKLGDLKELRGLAVLWIMKKKFQVSCNVEEAGEEGDQDLDSRPINFTLCLFDDQDAADCFYLNCMQMPPPCKPFRISGGQSQNLIFDQRSFGQPLKPSSSFSPFEDFSLSKVLSVGNDSNHHGSWGQVAMYS